MSSRGVGGFSRILGRYVDSFIGWVDYQVDSFCQDIAISSFVYFSFSVTWGASGSSQGLFRGPLTFDLGNTEALPRPLVDAILCFLSIQS